MVLLNAVKRFFKGVYEYSISETEYMKMEAEIKNLKDSYSSLKKESENKINQLNQDVVNINLELINNKALVKEIIGVSLEAPQPSDNFVFGERAYEALKSLDLSQYIYTDNKHKFIKSLSTEFLMKIPKFNGINKKLSDYDKTFLDQIDFILAYIIKMKE